LWDTKCLQIFVRRWPNKGRNMSPWQYTIFIAYKIKCCVIDWHVVFICYNTSGWKTSNKYVLHCQQKRKICKHTYGVLSK